MSETRENGRGGSALQIIKKGYTPSSAPKTPVPPQGGSGTQPRPRKDNK